MSDGVFSNEQAGHLVEEVRAGSVVIPIYRSPFTLKLKPRKNAGSNGGVPAAATKTYDSFVLAYYEGSVRHVTRRNKLGKARALAKEVAVRLNRDGVRAEYLTEKDRRILTFAKRAVEPIGLEVDEACRKFTDLEKRLKSGTLEQAVDFHNQHGQDQEAEATTGDVFKIYESHLTKKGAGDYHLRDTRRYLGKFIAEQPFRIGAIKTAEIDEFLAGLGGSARNKNNHRDAVLGFFNFAVETGFLPRGLPHAASFTTEFGEPRQKITTEQQAVDLMAPCDIYSPEELERILNACAEHAALRATLEIKALSGVRTEEISRLWWVMVAESDDCIRVPDAVGKIDARRVPILLNLKARLASHPVELKRGRIAADWAQANALYHAWQRICKKAGVPYRKNAFRNSYFTYRLAIVNNIVQVAEEGGTSVKMLKKNYLSRAPVSLATAQKWFSL
jgi:integrase